MMILSYQIVKENIFFFTILHETNNYLLIFVLILLDIGAN